MKIILLSADEELQNNLRKILSKHDHPFIIYSDSNKLFEEIDNSKISLKDYGLVFIDHDLAGPPVIEVVGRLRKKQLDLFLTLLTTNKKAALAIQAIKFGFNDFFVRLGKGEDVIEMIMKAESWKQLLNRQYMLATTTAEKLTENDGKHIIHKSSEMKEVLKLIKKVSNNDITVSISGESGTGKELVARKIHNSDKRKNSPFVAINCAAIPSGLLESELFGHEKGAFNDAHKLKIGKFEYANGGTIFLDEIGEMELGIQAKILRVIQEKEFARVGGNDNIKTDVRIISATNKNLKELVEQKKFRKDLYFRLDTFPIRIPPLRERKDDIEFLTYHFIKVFNKKLNKSLKGVDESASQMLLDYDWPGNVRELENIIERCMILTDSDEITCDVLPDELKQKDISIAIEGKNATSGLPTN